VTQEVGSACRLERGEGGAAWAGLMRIAEEKNWAATWGETGSEWGKGKGAWPKRKGESWACCGENGEGLQAKSCGGRVFPFFFSFLLFSFVFLFKNPFEIHLKILLNHFEFRV